MNSRLRFLIVYLLMFLVSVSSNVFSQSRTEENISDGWKFTRENPKSAEVPDYYDNYWTSVSLPHTWNNLDGQDGGSDYYRGIGWYRKQFTINAESKSKAIYLKFDAVSTSAEVYLNGKLVGKHKGGFGAFCFNITSLIEFDKTNILAVKVSNAKDSTISPLRGDFTVFGGIYRKVHLLILDPVSISPMDYASSGVYVHQKNVSDSKGEIEVSAVLENTTHRNQIVEAQFIVRDKSGVVCESASQQVKLDPSDRTFVTQAFILKNPHLWNGKNDPYEYSVQVNLVKDKKHIDEIHQNFGLRYYSVDPNEGFILNGKHYGLHGINRHQDRANMGWAITEKEHAEDMSLIEEIGATTIRLCHYQHDQYFYNLCDENGMVVWAELALVDEITNCPEFADICKQQLTELIKQNFNHPSIFFWSLENELIPDEMPEAYSKLIGELNTLAKQLDNSRLTTVATRSKYDCNEGMNAHSDVIGLNVYRGWYEKMPEDFAQFIDEQHKLFPKKALAVSEYGAGASVYQHEDSPAKPAPRGAWHPEEWQSHLHEVTWKAMAERKYIWGTFIWNMFDFGVDSRSEGDCLGRNDKGLVTYDRKIKKDAFYFYKSVWNAKPMVYITGRRYVNRSSSPVNVKVYSNCDSVKLFVNGELIKNSDKQNTILQWSNVKLVDGKNTIRVEGVKNGNDFSDACEWLYKSKSSDK